MDFNNEGAFEVEYTEQCIEEMTEIYDLWKKKLLKLKYIKPIA